MKLKIFLSVFGVSFSYLAFSTLEVYASSDHVLPGKSLENSQDFGKRKRFLEPPQKPYSQIEEHTVEGKNKMKKAKENDKPETRESQIKGDAIQMVEALKKGLDILNAFYDKAIPQVKKLSRGTSLQSGHSSPQQHEHRIL